MFNMFFLFTSMFGIFSLANLRGSPSRELSFLGEGDEWKQFSNFQERFSKRYETFQELELRFEIFRENMRTIILHNLESTQNYTMGINQFTDLTSGEFKEMYASGYKPLQSFGCKSFSEHDNNSPTSIEKFIIQVMSH